MKSGKRSFRSWPVLVAAGLLAGVVLWRRRAGEGSAGGSRWYARVYRGVYRVGFTPWDRGVPAPALVRFVEAPSAPPPGRALDLGCGTGTNSVYLAQHGWQVTGVDMVPQALAAARDRATAAGVSATFLEGDVTRLEELRQPHDFTLLVDAGCFHTLPLDRRDAYVAGVTAAAAPSATLLIFAFARRAFAPLKAGVTADEVRERFRGWEMVEAGRVTPHQLQEQLNENRLVTRAARRFDPWQYRLRRRPR